MRECLWIWLKPENTSVTAEDVEQMTYVKNGGKDQIAGKTYPDGEVTERNVDPELGSFGLSPVARAVWKEAIPGALKRRSIVP